MSEPHDRFVSAACAMGGQSPAAALAMLHETPDLTSRSIAAAAVAGDVPSVRALLTQRPESAIDPCGPCDWPPLLYACFSLLGQNDAARASHIAAAARVLIEAGADPNAAFFPPGSSSPLTALYGASGVAGNVELTRVLLEAGANPNDGESLFHAAEHGHFECLELLMAHGGDLNDRSHPAGNTPLAWLLDWAAGGEVGRRATVWLLDHGGDPNLPSGPLAETPLHVSARRRRAWAIELLLARGAQINARTAGGTTAYAHAQRRGFDDIAELLERHGADTTLDMADRLAMHLVRGALEDAQAMIAADPGLVPGMNPDQARILPDLAGRPLSEAVALLLDAGADIATRGLDGGTALHQAGWFGQPDCARVLIERGAQIDIRGDAHDSTPLGWVAHGSRYSDDAEKRGDAYAKVAEYLLAAGASLANPADPQGDPHGRWLLLDAGPAVAAVLERHGARR